jgi:uncharacterized protein (DUF1684 family)
MTIADTGPATFERDWAAWRAQREASLAGRHGFLAVTSLNWLSGEPQRFPDAPGRWRSGADGVTVDLDPGEELVIDGEPVRGHYSLGHIPERGTVSSVVEGLQHVYAAPGYVEFAAAGQPLRLTAFGASAPGSLTPFATCPLPPAENRLPVAVEAGEQAP